MKFNRWLWAGILLLSARALASFIPSLQPLSLSLPETSKAKPGHSEHTSASACQAARSAVVTLYAGIEFGSGSIVSANGLVLTNHHVIAAVDGGKVRARGWNNKLYTGQVVVSDPINDLALVQLHTKEPLPVIHLATLSTVQKGQKVCAIGSPFGRTGIITLGMLTGTRDNGDLESSILLHPGNSGGPLLNSQGDMVGVNKAIWLSESGENVGIGFATTATIAHRFIEQNHAKAKAIAEQATTPSLEELPQQPAGSNTLPESLPGANQSPALPDGARLGAMVNNQSLMIQLVEPQSPAEKAGLSAGDQLLAVNGQPLKRFEDLQAFLKRRPTSAVFTINRRQQQQDIQVSF
ncbi:MAG: S1C family serine protease [Lyngbya sp. HA4199-MV5]|jgi:serine protease Do|nr:S1C family serine protease [Lyngbya sp. HA4199-MV5]